MTSTPAPAPASPRAAAMAKGRQADSARRRQRVIAALSKAVSDGTEISVSGIARAVGVDRAFFYRHRDLLARLHAVEATPPATGDSNGPGVSRASLQTDLLAAGEADHQIRPERGLVPGHRRLLAEVAVAHHAGQLDDVAKLHLSPLAARVRLAQRSDQRTCLAAQPLARLVQVAQLRLEAAARFASLLVEA